MKAVSLGVLLLLVGCQREPPTLPPAPAPVRAASSLDAPLSTGLGTYHRAIACPAVTHGWFDEGLRLYYAFDLEGAQRAFARAAVKNDCAIASWGTALALGHNLNVPSMPDRLQAARGALAAAGKSDDPLTVGLLDALRKRYAGDDRGAGDRAYADAMRALQQTNPSDPDVAALFAEALLDLHPFAQWSPTGAPAPETPELVALLEASLKRSPEHPGLNHYYIHTMESSPHPERALPSADKVGTMMPAAGHLVHMPSHIYLRTGRYADAAEQNRKAIIADAKWAEAGRAGPLYAMYPLHDHHFLWLATLALGLQEEARKEADVLVQAATLPMLRAMPGMEPLLVTPVLTALRFSEWKRVLTIPAPPEAKEFPYAAGIWRFARARAQIALGQSTGARLELTELDIILANIPLERMMGANRAADVLRVAACVAYGDLDASEGRTARAIARLHEAVTREDALAYDEPPSWPLPAREVLGDVLLKAKRNKEAAEVFAAELAKLPRNPWAQKGLAVAEHE